MPPTSSRWTTAAAITWPAPSAAASSAGCAWRKYQTCTTWGRQQHRGSRTRTFIYILTAFLSAALLSSPSGCTFWGKKPWSRKKKILWQLGTLVGAPVGIALIAGIAIPAMIIGIPVYVGRKVRFLGTSQLLYSGGRVIKKSCYWQNWAGNAVADLISFTPDFFLVIVA